MFKQVNEQSQGTGKINDYQFIMNGENRDKFVVESFLNYKMGAAQAQLMQIFK